MVCARTRPPSQVRATVHSKIVIPSVDLSLGQRMELEQALTIENPAKERAMREMTAGADDLPDEIELFWEADGRYVIPRGFAAALGKKHDDIEWTDERVVRPIDTSLWINPILRDYQEKACKTLMSHEQGVYEAPAGSGKTVTGLELIRRLGQRALVIVNNTHIAGQWIERAAQHLGLSRDMIGLIGDGKWHEQDITIALQQTLWARRDSLEAWWEDWGLVMLDECHHAPASSFFDIIQRFPAKFRIGLSATPDKQKGLETLVEAAIGPIVTKTPREVLVQAGTIVNPTVEILPSQFSMNFWPTHSYRKDEGPECEYHDRGCNKRGMRHQNNYSDVIAKLIDDDARNDLLADRIVRAYGEGRAVLVLSRRLKHLDNMARRVIKAIGDEDVYRLSGKEKTDEKLAIYDRAEQGQLVIFSTVGDEALDIPRLDTLVMAFPVKNAGLIEQQLGRVARVHHEKAAPEVIDVGDNMGVLDNQLKARMRVYRKQGLTITIG